MQYRDRGSLVGGSWVEGEGEELISRNPARNGEIVWSGRAASAKQVETAVAAALRAFPEWSACGLESRIEILSRVEEVVEKRAEELAKAITEEMGKPIRESRGEARSILGKLKASIEAQRRLPDTALPGAPGRAVWRPHGVMAVIGPSNYPIHLLNTHIAPALLAGNTVVVKPSPITSASAQIYAEIMQEVGLADGVFNLVVGGHEVGHAMVAHHDVHAVAFTGGWGAGRQIMQSCLDQPRKLLALEMGGKNIAVVLEDAHIPQTVHELVLGACLTAGQRCTATSRLIVHRKVADELIDRLSRAFQRIKPGDPFADDTLMGPLATLEARDQFLSRIQTYEASGLKALVRSEALEGGAFVTPSMHLVEDEGEQAQAYLNTEFFAPNLAVQIVEDAESAKAICAQSAFGLSMSVFSENQAAFEEFSREVPCGIFNWNRSTNNASGLLPFGGLGYSGNHRPAGSTSALYCSRPTAVLERDFGDFSPDPVYGPVLAELIE